MTTNDERLRLRALFVAYGKTESAADQYQAAWEQNNFCGTLSWTEFYEWIRDHLKHGLR